MTHDNEEPSAASAGYVICPYVTGSVTRYCTLTPFTLTDAEREAVLAMACHCDTRSGLEWVRLSATLRGLLERTK